MVELIASCLKSVSQTTAAWQRVHILAHVNKHSCLESYKGQGEQTEPLQNDKKMTQVVSIMHLLIKTNTGNFIIHKP